MYVNSCFLCFQRYISYVKIPPTDIWNSRYICHLQLFILRSVGCPLLLFTWRQFQIFISNFFTLDFRYKHIKIWVYLDMLFHPTKVSLKVFSILFKVLSKLWKTHIIPLLKFFINFIIDYFISWSNRAFHTRNVFICSTCSLFGLSFPGTFLLFSSFSLLIFLLIGL